MTAPAPCIMMMRDVERMMEHGGKHDCKDGGIAPWAPAKATDTIRRYARGKLNISYKLHAKERLEERSLTTGDVLYVLKNGFVYANAEPARPAGFYRYAVEGKSPNSGGRTLRIIIIPSPCRVEIKVVTVMWADETA